MEKNNEILLDRRHLVLQICNQLEELPDSGLEKMHRKICGSTVVHIGNSLFFPSEELWEESKRKINND